MTESYDVILVGLGAMGSAAAHALVGRGLRVLGLEQFDIAHDRGSSHGRSRVIRKAYFEDSRYVPLLHRAYDLWRALEQAAGVELMRLNGCLNMGPADHACILGARGSAEQHGLAHEVLDADEIHRHWPGLRPGNEDIGIYEAEGGFLIPERAVGVQVDLARAGGAVIHTGEAVRRWTASSGGVSVETDDRRYVGGHLVITAGAWLAEICAELDLPLRVERQVQTWFQPKAGHVFTAARMPAFIHFLGDRAYYGIPMREAEGMKVARHHGGQITTADAINRQVTQEDEADVRRYLARHLPDADGPLLAAEVCMYTNTPDDHFIVDRHPQFENVLIAGGFSGHGFKFSPVVGEVLAEMVSVHRVGEGMELFSLRRFTGRG